MNSLELVLKEKKTLDNFLKAQRTTIAGISAERGKFIDEALIPIIRFIADENTLELALEPISNERFTYNVSTVTGEVILHPQQLADELDSELTKQNISNPTLGSTLKMLNNMSLSIQSKEIGLDPKIYDELEIYDMTIILMRTMGDLSLISW